MNAINDFAELTVQVDNFRFDDQRPQRLMVMAAMPFPCPLPLLPGSESFCWDWLAHWHRSRPEQPPRDIACYLIRDLFVARTDHFFYAGRPIASLEFMPDFTLKVRAKDLAGDAEARIARPTRVVEGPCFILGANGRGFGHFLIESISRIHVVQHLLGSSLPPFKVLLENTVAPWALTIMRESFGLDRDRLEFYDPEVENVEVREALFPTLAITSDRLHEINNLVIGELLGAASGSAGPDIPRLFVSRQLVGHRPGRDACHNEAELAAIAAHEYGFAVLAPETLPWQQQIRLFANARAVVGEFGSALHATMFGRRGQRVGVLHLENIVQSSISALRQQPMAYLTPVRDVMGGFRVETDQFRRFIDMLLAGD